MIDVDLRPQLEIKSKAPFRLPNTQTAVYDCTNLNEDCQYHSTDGNDGDLTLVKKMI